MDGDLDQRDCAPAHVAPDAGEINLTEKLLLFGGTIQLAGESRRGERRRVRSVCMGVERDRGISASSAVMSFAGAPQPDPTVDTTLLAWADARAAISPYRPSARASESGPPFARSHGMLSL
jgi:hypothetical protein